MTSKPTIPTPKRKVSNLVSFFESSTPSPSSITSSSLDFTPSTSSPSTFSTRRRHEIESPLSSPALFKPNSTDSNSNSIISDLPKGLVSNHVRKFSLEPKAEGLSTVDSRVESGALSKMDWTFRARDTGELRSEARVRTENEVAKVLMPLSFPSTSKLEPPSSTTSTPISPTPVTTPVSTSASTLTRYPPTLLPTPISIDKAKALGKKAFKPGRIAPLPPSTVAPTILIPANVSSTADGGQTKISIETQIIKQVMKEKIMEVPKEIVLGKNKRASITPPISRGEETADPFSDPPPITVVSKSSASISPARTIAPPRIKDSITVPSPPTINKDEKSVLLDPLSSISPSPTPPPPSYNDTLPNISRPSPRPVQPPSSTSPTSPKSTYPPSISYDPSLLYASTQSPTTSSSRPTRPLLNHSSSSQATTHTIKNLPASTIFKSGAEKLILPDLDRYLDGIKFHGFSDPNIKGILSETERESWEIWCKAGKEEKGWWSRLFSRKSSTKGKYVDLEAEQGRLNFTTANLSFAETKCLIFPPMHLIPEDLTVTDLKTNRIKVPLLGSLDSWLGIAIDGVLAGEGSSLGLKFETVEIFRDLMQMFTLLIGARVTSNQTSNTTNSWFHSLFITIPRILSLDFVSAFGMALLWLWVFTVIAGFTLYELYRFTGGWKGQVKELRDLGEGFDREGLLEPGGSCGGKERASGRNSRIYKMTITFLATSLYLPLSKIAISTLAWSSDLWIVPDPYTSSDDFPNPAPLGPSTQYYDTLDFCYRTTMLKPNGFKNLNWAWIILPVSMMTVLLLTIWLPWRIHKVVQAAAPKVDPFTELGEKRKDSPAEYTRLLAVDQSPYSFLYQAYRRQWASFKSVYMLVKLVNILLVVFISKENCIFRSHTSSSLLVIRQASLLGFMTIFLLADTISKPFIDMISNNSDRVSRIGFVILSLLGLLVALDVPGKSALSGPVTIAVDIISYGLNMYFSVIGTAFAMSYVKRFQYRLDFSIDIFNPHLDLAKHVSRRVWQETWSCLLLAAPEFKMPLTEQLVFTDNKDLPPYLLGFTGTQGERHVENLKILRGIGLESYSKAMRDRSLPDDCRIIQVRRTIHQYFVGPDIIWNPPHSNLPSGVTSLFGRLDVFPFPFVAVFRYDQNPTPIQITDVDDLELLIRQNESNEVRDSRKVRLALRSLDNQDISAPHSVTTLTSKREGVNFESRVNYQLGRLTICRNSELCWRGYNFSSGFEVKITYSDGEGQESDGQVRYGQKLVLTAEDLGITSDFRLTSTLAKLLRRNREIIETRLPIIDDSLAHHREYFFNQAQWKNFTLSHSFLFDVVANDTLSSEELDDILHSTEKDIKVQNITENYCGTILYLHERRATVMRSRISQWWYMLFDDIWRGNRADIPQLQNQPAAFSPHYRSSICYQPMSRPRLEEFLKEHSLWCEGKKGFFNSGFLNRIYFYLNEITFESTSRAIPIHLGSSPRRLKFDDLEHVVSNRSTRSKALTTGPLPLDPNQSYAFSAGSNSYYEPQDEGTNHDSNVIRARPAFTFEEIFDTPKLRFKDGPWNFIKDFGQDRILGTALVWLGLRPFSHDHRAHPSDGISLSLRGGKEGEGWKLPRNVKSREEKGDEIVF